MSRPVNPLSKFATYQVRHVLLAFDNTDAACQYEVPKNFLGKCGEAVPKLTQGKGVIIVNELQDPSYSIQNLAWSFDFFSPTSVSTTISAGTLTLSDGRGNQFPSFLRRVSKQLGVAETRLTFMLVTTFAGMRSDNNKEESVVSKPLIFQMTDLSTGFRKGLSNRFTMNFVLMYSTLAQLPQFSSLNQFTITNSENSPVRSVPSGASMSPKIMSRKDEDKMKRAERNTRLQRSAPMRSLKELFSGFELELKEMRYSHKAQLQEFLSIVKPDFRKKIKTPKQKRAKGEALPIDYAVKIDEAYKQYPINNRNLATEQIESKNTAAGIEALPVAAGSTLYSAIDAIMKTSMKVGDDVSEGFAYKTVVSSRFDLEGTLRNTAIVKRYEIPRNKEGVKDTGTNAQGKVQTLELTYMEGDVDIMSVSIASSPASEFIILEEDSDDLKDDNLFSSSQREQITFERSGSDEFMKSGFSGLRAPTSPRNNGNESAVKSTLVDSLRHTFNIAQPTFTVVQMAGNSDLYSDLARNPLRVEEEKGDGAVLFKFPEYYPMYVKLKIRIGSSQATGHTSSPQDETYWYHTYHYHLSGVTNNIVGGRFTQTLRLLSTDDAI